MDLKSMDFEAEVSFSKTYIEKANDSGTWIVEGYASTSHLDSQNHIISPEAIKMGAESLKQYNTVLFNHDVNRPIGKTVDSTADDGGLKVKVAISKTEPKIWEQIKDGTLSKFSIRGQILDSEYLKDERTMQDYLLIKGMQLHETSMVSVPANVNAKSLNWYIEKALEKTAYYKPNADMSMCMDRRIAALKDNGMGHSDATITAWIECAKAHGAHKELLDSDLVKELTEEIEKKNYRLPGESVKDCVSRKIGINMKEKNMTHDQAVAVALSECKASKSMEKDDVEKKKYPWDKCIQDQKDKGYSDKVAAEICAAIKNRTIRHMVDEWGMAKTDEEAIEMVAKKFSEDKMYAYAWEKFTEMQKAHGDCSCGGECADCVKKSNDGDKGGKSMETKDEVKKSEETVENKEETKTEEVKKSDEGKIDVSALRDVITQLQDMVKEVNSKSETVKSDSEAIKSQAEEAKKAIDEINKAKSDILDVVKSLNEVMKSIPIRKGQSAEEDTTDRTKETVVTKKLADDEKFQKANVFDQLHMLIERSVNE